MATVGAIYRRLSVSDWSVIYEDASRGMLVCAYRLNTIVYIARTKALDPKYI